MSDDVKKVWFTKTFLTQVAVAIGGWTTWWAMKTPETFGAATMATLNLVSVAFTRRITDDAATFTGRAP